MLDIVNRYMRGLDCTCPVSERRSNIYDTRYTYMYSYGTGMCAICSIASHYPSPVFWKKGVRIVMWDSSLGDILTKTLKNNHPGWIKKNKEIRYGYYTFGIRRSMLWSLRYVCKARLCDNEDHGSHKSSDSSYPVHLTRKSIEVFLRGLPVWARVASTSSSP
jgi:hypothetical protein